MKSLTPYLIFDGNAREAMQFYASALGGELHITNAESMPNSSPAHAGMVLHATLRSNTITLMASDNIGSAPFQPGNTVWLTIDCSTADEQSRLFEALSAGGTISMPLQDTFWGAHFGMFTDRFGNHWMLNLDK